MFEYYQLHKTQLLFDEEINLNMKSISILSTTQQSLQNLMKKKKSNFKLKRVSIISTTKKKTHIQFDKRNYILTWKVFEYHKLYKTHLNS